MCAAEDLGSHPLLTTYTFCASASNNTWCQIIDQFSTCGRADGEESHCGHELETVHVLCMLTALGHYTQWTRGSGIRGQGTRGLKDPGSRDRGPGDPGTQGPGDPRTWGRGTLGLALECTVCVHTVASSLGKYPGPHVEYTFSCMDLCL